MDPEAVATLQLVKGLVGVVSVSCPAHSICVTLARRELLWPKLDKLLRDEDESLGATTTYIADIPEYRAVFIESGTSPLEKNWSFANDLASYDIHHPCRCSDHASEDVPLALDKTLKDLQTDYVDLYGVKSNGGSQMGVLLQFTSNTNKQVSILKSRPG